MLKTSWHTDCDNSVYTGYLDVDAGAKHLFFYFFESRSNPDKGMPLLNNAPEFLTRL